MLGWWRKSGGNTEAPLPVPDTGKTWTGEITELADEDDEEFLVIPSASDQAKTRLEAQVRQQTDQIEALKAQTERLKAALHDEEKRRKTEVGYQEKLLQQEQEKVSDCTRKLYSLEREKQSALKALAESHKSEVEAIKASEALVKVEVEQIKKKNLEFQSLIERLTSESQKNSLDYKAAVEGKTKQLQQLTETVAKLEDNLAQQKRLFQEREACVSTSKGEEQSRLEEKFKQQGASYEAQVKESRDQVSLLKQKVLSQEKAIEDNKAEAAVVETKLKLLLSENEQLRKDAQRMVTKENEQSAELAKKAKENAALRSDLIKSAESELFVQNKLAEEKERLSREIEKLSSQEAKAQSDLVNVKQLLENSTKKEHELQQLVTTLRSENEAQKFKIKSMHESVNEILSLSPQTQQQPRLLERYKAKMAKVMQENPNSVPVRCVRSEECTIYPLLARKSFAVNKDFTLSKFNEHIRSKLNLNPDQPLSVYVDYDGVLPQTEVLDTLHKACAYEDGFLRLKYSHLSRQNGACETTIVI